MKLDNLHKAPATATHRSEEAAGLPASGDTGAALAWQREMERAQVGSWFQGTLPQRDDHAASDPSQRTLRELTATPSKSAFDARPPAHAERTSFNVVQDEDTRAAMTATGLAAKPTASPAAQAVAGGQTRADVRAGAGLAEPNAVTADTSAPVPPAPRSVRPGPGFAASSDAEAEESTARGTSTPRRSEALLEQDSQLPVRVHVEGDAEHSTVWLGVDASARASLPAITEAVSRWLAQAGYGTPTWICNGQAVDDPRGGDGPHPIPADRPFKIEPPIGESA